MSTLNQRLEQLIINLKVIAKLECNQRLLFKNRVVSIRNHYPVITPMIRTMAGESRDDVILGLADLLEDIDRLVNDYLNSSELQNPNGSVYDRDMATPVIMSLNRLKIELPHIYDINDHGLNAAKQAYSDDPIPVSKLEELIDNFKLISRKVNMEIAKASTKFGLDAQINGTSVSTLVPAMVSVSEPVVQTQVKLIEHKSRKEHNNQPQPK